jgi:hypothetical protein
VSLSTLRDFEKGRHNLITATLTAMRKAVEDGGIGILFQRGIAVGIVRGVIRPTSLERRPCL